MKWKKAKVGEHWRSKAGSISSLEVVEGGEVTFRGHVLRQGGREIYRTDRGGVQLLKRIAETLHDDAKFLRRRAES